MLSHMEPIELRQAVAEALGWSITDGNSDSGETGRLWGVPPGGPSSVGDAGWPEVPHYEEDIGLAHSACAQLLQTGTEGMLWLAFLYRAVSAEEGEGYSHGSVVLHATAAQYCHAALEVREHHQRLCRDTAATNKVLDVMEAQANPPAPPP